MKKITLITGVAGTTGSAILDYLSKNDPDVVSGRRLIVGYDNFFRGNINNIKSHLAESYFIFRQQRFQEILEQSGSSILNGEGQIDEIYHMAAVVPTKYFYESPEMTFEENCKGTIDLFNWALRYGVERFIVGSTSEVYGHINPEHLPVKENEMSHFDSVESSTRWSYAEGKLLTEHVLNKSKDKIKVCHLRFANTYGVRDFDENHIIPYLIRRIVDNQDLVVNKYPREFYRTFLNNKDSARACVELTRKGVSGVAYNVGSQEEVSIYELITLVKRLVEEITGNVYTGEIKYEIDRPGDPHRRVLSTQRLFDVTGFVPQVKLSDGVKEMIKYYILHKGDIK